MNLQLLNIAEMFYVLTVMVLKISIAIFYLKIMQSKAQKRVIYAAATSSTVVSIAMFFFVIFQCGAYKGAPEYVIHRMTNQCVSSATMLGMTYTHAVITMLTDWVFLVMPIWLLWGSNMTMRTKVAVGLLLAFASMSGIASISRFPSIQALALPQLEFFCKWMNSLSDLNLTDQIASAKNIAIWSALEPGIGIIAGCVVVMRPLFRGLTGTHKHPSRSYIDDEQMTRTPRRRSPSDISVTETVSSIQVEEPQEPKHPAFLEPPNEPDLFPRSSLVKKVFRSSRRDAREPGLSMFLFSAANAASRPGSRSASRTGSRSGSRSGSRPDTSWSVRPGTGASAISKRPATMAAECDPISEVPPVPKLHLAMSQLPKETISANVATKNLFARKRASNSPSLPLHLFTGSSFDET
jgi:hypothetical protein